MRAENEDQTQRVLKGRNEEQVQYYLDQFQQHNQKVRLDKQAAVSQGEALEQHRQAFKAVKSRIWRAQAYPGYSAESSKEDLSVLEELETRLDNMSGQSGRGRTRRRVASLKVSSPELTLTRSELLQHHAG